MMNKSLRACREESSCERQYGFRAARARVSGSGEKHKKRAAGDRRL
jgi:hypothetical protein